MLTSKKIAAFLLSIAMGFCAFEAQAAQDMVLATVASTGENAALFPALPSKLQVDTPYTIEYHFTNTVNIDVHGFAVKPVLSGAAELNVISDTCPATLGVNTSCDVKATVTATASGNVTLQVQLVEGSNTFLLHKDTASTILEAPDLVGASTVAAQYYVNSGGQVTFTFTNNGMDTAIISSVTPNDTGNLLSQVVSNCSGASLASGANCKITALLNSGAVPGQYAVGFNFNYNGTVSGQAGIPYSYAPTVSVVNVSSLAITAAPTKLVAYTGEVAQDVVTLTAGNGPVVDIVPTLNNSAVTEGALTIDNKLSTCGSALNAGESCNYVISYAASQNDSGKNPASFVSALANFSINYQDGSTHPPIIQPILAVQVDHNYFINMVADLSGIKSQLPSNMINAMLVANNAGNVPVLYVGTPAGLAMSKDHGSTWSDATTLNGLPSDNVKAIFAQGDDILVATDNGIASSINGGFYFDNAQTWDTTTNGIPQAITQTTTNTINTIYVGTTTGLYSNATGIFIQVIGVPASVTQVAIGSSGNVYAIAGNHLYRGNGGTFTPVTSNCEINGITTSVGDFTTVDVFAASSCGLLYAYAANSQLTQMLLSQPISTIAATSGGTVFYGINANNIFSWNFNNTKSTLTNNTDLTSPNIMAIDPKDGYVYAGSSNGGFSVGKIDAATPTTVTFIPQSPALTGSISSILPLDNNVYVGTNTGLYTVGLDGTITHNSDVVGAVNKVIADADGNIYLATDNGLSFSTDQGQTFTVASAKDIQDIALGQDTDGTPVLYMVDSSENLYHVMLSDVLNNSVPSGLTALHTGVLKVAADNNGTEYHFTTSGDIWRCTNNGNSCGASGVGYFNTINTLAYVNGNLYIGTVNSGLQYFNGTNFAPVDGVASSAGSVGLGLNNEMYVATSTGVYQFSTPTSAATSFSLVGATYLGINNDGLYIVSDGQLLMTHLVPSTTQSTK